MRQRREQPSAGLTESYGFKGSDITVLTDFDATKAAMQAGIKKLVASGRPGDVLLLHYSGHGANVPDKNGDEADERDEILCPTDLDWKSPLTDDWLRKALNRLRKGVRLTVIMDCCHSGTNTRSSVRRTLNPFHAICPTPGTSWPRSRDASSAGRSPAAPTVVQGEAADVGRRGRRPP